MYKATHNVTGKVYALKRIKMDNEKDGFPITAIREIKILKSLDHKNIVKLENMLVSKPNQHNSNRGSVYLVFEYLEHDMNGVLDSRIRFEKPHIKCLIQQLLEGIGYLHD